MRLPARLSRRDLEAHKGMFGHVLILAGSSRYSGAAVLCLWGALRSGAGLVTLGLPKGLAGPVIGVKPPDAMLLPLPETPEGTLSDGGFAEIEAFASGVNCLAIGPGLGLASSTQELARRLILELQKPMVIDASAIDALTGHTDVLKKGKFNSDFRIITPHPGEMARLTGIKVPDIQEHRKDIAKEFSNEYNVTVVLKGKGTVVASPDGTLYINSTGNPGMARGGSGDILSGMIAAFLGQGLSAFEAAKYAVYLHGLAGDLAAREKTQLGMIASDIVERIPEAIKASK
jgi:ADP-dependent NAD(P)H-hydrate dehydratase / NAD(P)H-hydrate epimerase